MRIDTILGGLQGLENAAASRSNTRQQVSQQRADHEDVAELSTNGFSISELSAQALSAPDIRTDRVNSLREQIAAGTYQPDPQRIASAIIDGLLAR